MTSTHASFALWDIDREFQTAYEAYGQWQTRHRRRRRPMWALFRSKTRDDTLAKALSLGRQIQRLMDSGKELFGARFEQGDSRCHTVLSAQLLRLQYEIRQPLYDCAISSSFSPLPIDDMITAATSIRRICLNALREQFNRCDSRTFVPVLPPPRFKVNFCPFADQARQSIRAKSPTCLRTKKLKPNDRYDDREVCPHCDVTISVTAHSGLPDFKNILFTSHVARDSLVGSAGPTFACSSCYKTFDDSYAFLDHMYQKQIGSANSCMKRTVSGHWTINDGLVESNPVVVEQCLKNCLLRELTRARSQKLTLMSKVTVRELDPSVRDCELDVALSYSDS